MSDISTPSQAFATSFPLGRNTIGRYELLSPIGRGGMAAVYLGRLSGMAGFEKLVAIKVIYPHLAGEEEFVGMFLDEARLSAKIHHQNVAEVFEVGEDDGLYYMVAELVRGRSLQDLMAASNREAFRIPPRLYLSIVAKVCDALQSAHTLKNYDGKPLFLVHRDISPSNILLSYDGNVKLIDFGIASACERITATRSGVLKGKSGFLAPEQLLGEPVDRRFDIFSLGIVLYLLATGKHPFPGETAGERHHRILNLSPPSPRSIVAEIPLELEQIIDKALSRAPEHRHQTAEELGKDIRTLLGSLGGLMDSPDIGSLMTRLFAEEIAEEETRIRQAIATRSKSVDPMPTPGPQRDKPHDSNQWDAARPPESHRDETWRSDRRGSVPETEMMARLPPAARKAPSKNNRKKWSSGLMVSLGGLVLVLGLSFYFAETDSAVTANGTDRKSDGVIEQNLDQQASKLVFPKDPESAKDTAAHSEGTIDPGSEGGPSVKILLKGLPSRATVQLDGRETAVIKGTIVVPVDGREHELTVSATGHLPYAQTIAPAKNGELTVRMKKKSSISKKKSYTKPLKGKVELDDHLLGCPYCKKQK